MKTFTAEGKPLAELEVSDNDMPGVTCGRIVFSDPAGRSQLITLRVGTVPARGVEPARYEVYLTSWNPDDLSQKWETKLTTEPQDGTPAACATDRLDATTDGKWLTVANVGTDFSSFVVAAESGAAQSVDYYPMPLGHFVGSFIGTNPASLSNVDDLRVIDPADNSVVNVMHGRSTDGGTTALDAVVNAASEPNEATWLEDGETVVAYHNFATHIVNVRTGALVHSIEFPEEVNGFSADPLVDPVSNHLLIHYACSGGCSDRLEGYEWGTWRKLWSQSRIDNMCTTHSGQVTVAANDQVAILDAATGNQIQFTTELEDCGDVFGNFGYNEKSGKMYRLTN
ncbi:hypothetical protein ACWDTG_02395 [Rhodococcus zopfii]|uniref:hypothetical protein n=1 Tax=Rhodococcus zopfii TaxID=43772 RepID=UPI0011110EB6|nr:hypothetical protein [Rhodococcus zopfii]